MSPENAEIVRDAYEPVARDGRWWRALTLRDGLMVRSETYAERNQALEAAGLRK
jgi:hypothetical protein